MSEAKNNRQNTRCCAKLESPVTPYTAYALLRKDSAERIASIHPFHQQYSVPAGTILPILLLPGRGAQLVSGQPGSSARFRFGGFGVSAFQHAE